MMSHDLEDLIAVIDGRNDIVENIASSPLDAQEYIKYRINDFLNKNEFDEALPGFSPPDKAGQSRLKILSTKLKRIAEL